MIYLNTFDPVTVLNVLAQVKEIEDILAPNWCLSEEEALSSKHKLTLTYEEDFHRYNLQLLPDHELWPNHRAECLIVSSERFIEIASKGGNELYHLMMSDQEHGS